MNDDQQGHLEELRKNYQRRLRILEQRSATFGLSTPPEILIEIEDIRNRLNQLDVEETKNKTQQTTQAHPKQETRRKREIRFLGILLLSIYEYEETQEYRILGMPVIPTAIIASIVVVVVVASFAFSPDTPVQRQSSTETRNSTAVSETNTAIATVPTIEVLNSEEIIGRWQHVESEEVWYRFFENGAWIGTINVTETGEGTYRVLHDGTVLELRINGTVNAIEYKLAIDGDKMVWIALGENVLTFKRVSQP